VCKPKQDLKGIYLRGAFRHNSPMRTETSTALFMGLGALILLVLGAWLIRRYDAPAHYQGIGSPYPYAGFFYEIGTVLLMSGGFLLIFALAVFFL
jgi:hypothetical protein